MQTGTPLRLGGGLCPLATPGFHRRVWIRAYNVAASIPYDEDLFSRSTITIITITTTVDFVRRLQIERRRITMSIGEYKKKR